MAGRWLLGGTVGVGKLAFAVLIGPLVHYFLPLWTVDTGVPEDAPTPMVLKNSVSLSGVRSSLR